MSNDHELEFAESLDETDYGLIVCGKTGKLKGLWIPLELGDEEVPELAMETPLAVEVDWNELQMSPQDAYEKMAENVIEQMESVTDNERAAVATATMTKLLVENFVLKYKLENFSNHED